MDNAELAIFQGILEQVASEMDSTLERFAFSPIISEALDRASGIYDARTGGVIAQGRTGLPIFIGVMQYTVASLLAERTDFRPGDVYIMNDPYRGGSHLMDVRLIAPYYAGGELLCFLANSAHWNDIGGAVAGGFSAQARSIHHEGLRIGPTKIMAEGRLVEDVKAIILDNVRVPNEPEGDLLAQIGAIDVGRRRMDAVIAKYGVEGFRRLAEELATYSERMMRAQLATIPNGRYESAFNIDDDGIGFEPLTVRCAIDILDDSAFVDFAGTSPPCAGPVNAPISSTKAAVLIGFMHLFPDLPINHGTSRPIQISVPESCFINAKYPSPVAGAAADTSARIIDSVMVALGKADPTLRQGMPFGTSSNLTLAGSHRGSEYIMYFFAGGGYGGWAGGDGLSNACSTVSMAKTSPIEVLEERYPVRFEYYRLRNGSAGAGQYRGGLGIEYEIVFEGDSTACSFMMDRGKFPPLGVEGGGNGTMTQIEIKKKSGESFFPPHVTKGQENFLTCGDRVRVATPGGGYGPPSRRPDSSIEADKLAEFLG